MYKIKKHGKQKLGQYKRESGNIPQRVTNTWLHKFK